MAGGKRPSGTPPEGTPETPGAGQEPAPDRPAGSRRPKRAAPTIDLQATEVPADPPPAAAASSAQQNAPRDPPRRFPDESDMPKFQLPDGISAGALAAGLAGGLLVSIVLFVLWLTGMVPIRYAGTTAMRARVSVLEMQMHEIANRAGPDAKIGEALEQRLAKLEQANGGASADPKQPERLADVENAMKALGVALAALNSRVEASAARIDAAEKAATDTSRPSSAVDEALANRIAALERATAAAQAELAKAAPSDKDARRALLASALRVAVLSGEPFDLELSALKPLGADPALVAALEPLASAGVPTRAALGRELSELVPALLKSAGIDGKAAPGGFLDRLQANASKLVRIRPSGEVVGGDPAALAARVELRAARGDLAGAYGELKTLPAAARAPAETWMQKFERRRAAVDASAKLAAGAYRSLQAQ